MHNGPENIEARIIELYKSGNYSKTGICEELGIGKKKLYRVLREAGLIEPEGTNPPPVPEPVQDFEEEEEEDEEEPLAPVVMGSPTKLVLGAAVGLAGGYMIWGRRRSGEGQDPTNPDYSRGAVERARPLAWRLLSLIGR